MKKNKMTKCKVCGAEIAKNATNCPHCGASRRAKAVWRPIPCFLALLLIFIIAIASCDSNDTDIDYTAQEYTDYSAHKLLTQLNTNAMAAKELEDTFVSLSGTLLSRDADGSYFTIGCSKEDCWDCVFSSITCHFTDEVKDDLLKIDDNTKIVVKCKITEVDEFWGYTVMVYEIKVK